MKAMHYDFENVGGLLQVIAVPPASFVQIRKDYASGLNYLELRNREDIVSIPVYANDTYSYNEDKEVNDAGDCWNVSIEGVIPKLSPANHQLMEMLERGLWYVRAGGRTHAVRHKQDKRTFRVGTERHLIHVHLHPR